MIDVAGNARERGRAHGEALREQIERGLALWHEHAGPVASAERYLGAARHWTPAAVDELEGIAEGAGISFEALLAYNLGDELRVFGPLERCTSAGLQRGSLGVPVSGQMMDTWPATPTARRWQPSPHRSSPTRLLTSLTSDADS